MRNAALSDAVQQSDCQRPRRKALQEHALLDEMLLYAPSQEAAFSLNASAKAIWELCDGQRTLTEICRELGGRFHCPGNQLLADVRNTLLQLQKLGLLETEAASSSVPSR